MEEQVWKKCDDFFSKFQSVEYEKGSIIIHPEESPRGIFYLKSGYVREYGISLQGIEITLHMFAPHSFFPMMWGMNDIPNRYYYEALTEITACITPRDKVIDFLKSEPLILMDLTKRLLLGLDRLTTRIEYLTLGKASTKVISVLLYLARHFGEVKDKQIVIKSKFTHRDIAAFAGITRETTSREWEKLQKKGLISYDDQFIQINNIDDLKEALST